MRSLLVLVVLVPTLGMVVLAATSGSAAKSKRDVATRVQDEIDVLSAIVDARVAIAGEETQTAVVAVASDLGVDIDVLSELYGIDFRAALDAVRDAVDADPTLPALAELADGLVELQALRTTVDEGTATFEDSLALFRSLTNDIDAAWRAQSAVLQVRLHSSELRGSVHARERAVRTTFEALSWGSERAVLSIRLLQGEPEPAVIARLLDATSRHRAAIEDYDGVLGPAAAAVWEGLQQAPSTQRFERTLDRVTATLLRGETSPLSTDPTAFGEAFIDGAPWGEGLNDMVRAAGTDLEEEAVNQEQAASRALWLRAGSASLLTLLAITCALLLARSVTRPIRRLEGAAHQIHAGRFDLDPIETGGPRELSDTAVAFNEMATTLATVESHAVALADDPDAPFLDHQLPGRTGRALQVALNRLRASIRGAEQHRRALEIAATHDGLTGLLNRTAALTMIERDLARARRVDGSVMALFIDLDGFKLINDHHGHAAGDDALRLTAEALGVTTRESDVVARLGGDEFLVAGVILDDRDEVERLAERIRAAVASIELAGRTGAIPLRCSIGMALSEPDTASVDDLIQRADAALYVAKARGRDQAVWHEHPDATDSAAGAQSPS